MKELAVLAVKMLEVLGACIIVCSSIIFLVMVVVGVPMALCSGVWWIACYICGMTFDWFPPFIAAAIMVLAFCFWIEEDE